MNAVYFMEDVTKILFVNVLQDGMENFALYMDALTIVMEMGNVYYLLIKNYITSKL